MCTWGFCVVYFFESGCEALCDCLFGFCAAFFEAVAEGGERGRGDEEVYGVEVCLFYLTDALVAGL